MLYHDAEEQEERVGEGLREERASTTESRTQAQHALELREELRRPQALGPPRWPPMEFAEFVS